MSLEKYLESKCVLIYYIIFKSQNLGFRICSIPYSEEKTRFKKREAGQGEHSERNPEDNCSLIAGSCYEGLLVMVIWKIKILGSSYTNFKKQNKKAYPREKSELLHFM